MSSSRRQSSLLISAGVCATPKAPVTNPFLRRNAIAVMWTLCCRHRQHLSYSRHIAPVEDVFVRSLLMASLETRRSWSTSLLGMKLFSSTHTAPVRELDGTPCRELFTCLCVAEDYTEDQLVNMQVFSLLYTWILNLYPQQLVAARFELVRSKRRQKNQNECTHERESHFTPKKWRTFRIIHVYSVF